MLKPFIVDIGNQLKSNTKCVFAFWKLGGWGWFEVTGVPKKANVCPLIFGVPNNLFDVPTNLFDVPANFFDVPTDCFGVPAEPFRGRAH